MDLVFAGHGGVKVSGIAANSCAVGRGRSRICICAALLDCCSIAANQSQIVFVVQYGYCDI